jgi:hypothetical protein
VFAALVALAAGGAGCKATAPRSPEALRAAWASALRRGDARAAYALLDPRVRRELPRRDFERRFAAENARSARTLAQVSSGEGVGARTATTIVPGSAPIHWLAAEGRWWVVGGLPGQPILATPRDTARALISRMRAGDLGPVGDLATAELQEQSRADLRERASALEAALVLPDAIQLAPDGQRAEIPYGEGRVLRLQQTADGWRVAALE